LDRDGVLNVNRSDYVKSLDEVCFYQEALEALKLLKSLDVGVILISNQSAVNRGLIDRDEFWAIHEGVVRQVEDNGGSILAAFYCPHRPDEKCDCRKPAPAMIEAACRFARIESAETFFIGDRESDMMAAQNAGSRGVLLCREGISAATDACALGGPSHTSLMDAVLSIYGRNSG
jgi:D-glycero-D-manno-heptose 1,7-bisphosphate phosphatase